ncbi:MAG TPA: hypothetical protein VEF04_04120, partial [Blastocatellia bacterium]|nr:hypothetical protein [Blastocatellia bacterium]
TPKVEYPAVRNVYKLFGAEDRLATVQMDAPHNYNRQSREAVYGWFAHWFQGRALTTPIKEKTSSVATLPELLVFHGRTRPANELNEQQLTESLIASAKQQLKEAAPHDAATLAKFREQFFPAYKFALMAEMPRSEDIRATSITPTPQSKKQAAVSTESIVLSRRGKDDRVELTIWKSPTKSKTISDQFTLIVIPHSSSVSQTLIDELIKSGQTVAVLKCFAGQDNLAEAMKTGFFTTYNRTDAANRVQDVLTAIAYLKSQLNVRAMNVIGQGEAGLWALLARGLAPEINRMVIDANMFDSTSDEAFLKQLPIPGIRRAGDFTTAITLAPLTPLLIHSTGQNFQSATIANIYRQLDKPEDFQSREEKLSEANLIKWVEEGSR